VTVPSFTQTVNTTISGKVSSVTESDSSLPVSSLKATIYWGDGSSDIGALSGSGGKFTVSGTHTYTSVDKDTLTVKITDSEGGSGQGSGTVNVPYPALLSVSSSTLSAVAIVKQTD